MFKHLRTMLRLVVPTMVSSDSAAIQESTSTRDNLQIAFNVARNANARYLAFAKKADEEGFGEVACFVLLQKAEEIHDRNHSDVIRKMGATPALHLEAIEVKSTHVNLKTAIADEKYEHDNQDALDNLQKRTGKNHTNHVCPDCGNTLEELNIVKCLVCRHSKSGLIAVS